MKKHQKQVAEENKIYGLGYRDGAVDYLADIVAGFIKVYTTKKWRPTLMECGGANNKEFFHMLVCNIYNQIPYCAVKEIAEIGKEKLKHWEDCRKEFGEEVHKKLTENDAW